MSSLRASSNLSRKLGFLHLAPEVLQRLELLEVAPPAIEATVALVAARVLCAIFREVALRPLQPHKLSEVAVSFVRSLPANQARFCWHFSPLIPRLSRTSRLRALLLHAAGADGRTSWRRDLFFFYHRDGDGAVLGKSKSNDFGVLSLLLSLSLSLSLMLMLMLMHQQKLH